MCAFIFGKPYLQLPRLPSPSVFHAASQNRLRRWASDSLFLATTPKGALDRRRSQKLLDPFRFVESLNCSKTYFRCKFEGKAPGDLAADVPVVAFQRVEHFLFVASAKRHDVNGGQPQVGAYANFRNRDHVAFNYRIMDIAARKHVGELVTDQFADA